VATASLYIRHPDELPVRLTSLPALNLEPLEAVEAKSPTAQKHLAGVVCRSDTRMTAGSGVKLCSPLAGEALFVRGCVRWCLPRGESYVVGIEVESDTDGFNLRQIEQLCRIESYRLRMAREQGRQLASEDAAREWISRFAADFPQC
jgi:hypothetical protein